MDDPDRLLQFLLGAGSAQVAELTPAQRYTLIRTALANHRAALGNLGQQLQTLGELLNKSNARGIKLPADIDNHTRVLLVAEIGDYDSLLLDMTGRLILWSQNDVRKRQGNEHVLTALEEKATINLLASNPALVKQILESIHRELSRQELEHNIDTRRRTEAIKVLAGILRSLK